MRHIGVLWKAGDPAAEGWIEWLRVRAAVTSWPCAPDVGAPPLGAWRGDVLFSYRCPYVLTAEDLARAPVAINCHPGTPDYPGIGATNFALYEGASRFGATAHHMAERVDHGHVIEVVVFPIDPCDTVVSLTRRTHATLVCLAYHMAEILIAGEPLPVSPWQWTRRPFRRTELEALCETTPEMSDAEVARRVRATTYPGFRSAVPR